MSTPGLVWYNSSLVAILPKLGELAVSDELIRSIEMPYLRQDMPDFGPGDTVRVYYKVIEGGKERIQPFEGVVIARKHGGSRETFTVYRIASHGVPVERTFPLHSPRIDRIEVVRRGDVRRAKLYYLRGRTGKAARIKEKRTPFPQG